MISGRRFWSRMLSKVEWSWIKLLRPLFIVLEIISNSCYLAGKQVNHIAFIWRRQGKFSHVVP